LSKLHDLRWAERYYAAQWAAAGRIHGSAFLGNMCTGDGCACQFYRKKKAQQDIKKCQDELVKFGY